MDCKHIIFDLDDTLYKSSTMHEGVRNRMVSFVANFFNVSFEEAFELRKRKLKDYATTIDWLLHEGLENIESFFSSVHPESESDELEKDENLRPLLESIDIPKSILTNSPREHSYRVLKKLGVEDLFDNITDIRDCGLRGKPYADSYLNAVKKSGCKIDEVIFLDDLIKYAEGFPLIGGVAVVVGNKNGSHLPKDAKAIVEINELISLGKIKVPNGKGRLLHIDSVYGLPNLLQNINDI